MSRLDGKVAVITGGARGLGAAQGRLFAAEGATVVAVSSMFSDAWSGDNAVDGDMSTEWATAGSGDPGNYLPR